MISNRKDFEAMKDRLRKKRTLSASSSSLFFIFICCTLSLAIAFSTFRIFGVSFKPILISTWQSSAMSSLYTDLPFPLQTQHAISFPDFFLFTITNPPTNALKLKCRYYRQSSSTPNLQLPPISSSSDNNTLFIRCPISPYNSSISLLLSPPIKPLTWDHLAYTAVLDPQDNTTIVFVKGFNLRPARLSDPTRYECLFGWYFRHTKYTLTTPATSAAQEIFRCKTPLSVLHAHHPPLVTIKTKGRRPITLPSVARPQTLPGPTRPAKQYQMCVCTMVRNQARFLREWIIYHTRIGVQRWFIYDNNSDDDILEVSSGMRVPVSVHDWPWIKTQEAGFAHCALRARASCEWIGFIDVDEFVYLPGNVSLSDVLRNNTSRPWVGELRTACYSFGPSRRKRRPVGGVMVGYTCRMAAPERHKSIVKADALNPSLVNIVHHFHLKEGMRYVNVESRVMVINHYKYQVWEVFKEKFYRRVATYVADWKEEENVGSKDRAPGLGTKAVEPLDWSVKFCEVNDTGLKKFVLREFVDRETGSLPW